MAVQNFTPLDTHGMIKTHFPKEKRTFDVLLMLMGMLTAAILIIVGYFVIQQRFQ